MTTAQPPLDAALFAPDQLLADGVPVRLRASRCAECDRHEFPARNYCPSCGGPSEETQLSSDATVIGVTAVKHAPPGALVPVPYTVAVAAFREGVAVLGAVPGVSMEDLRFGDRVRSVGMLVGEAVAYAWQPI
jgi:uncharacterized OB-fold protein